MTLTPDWRLCTCSHIAVDHSDEGACLHDCLCDGWTEVVA